jgi:serine/threonine protein kinase
VDEPLPNAEPPSGGPPDGGPPNGGPPDGLPPTGDLCPQCGHEVGGAWLVCAWCGHQLAAAAELPVGTRLNEGRYQVLSVIGRGGFGITYDAGDRRLQRRVAVKELFPESAVRHGSVVLTPPQGRSGFQAARDRFLREARVLARFTHPGIVRVFEVFEEHGTAYLVMELLEGRTLIDLLQQRGEPFTEAEILDVAGRVAAALRPVHAAGVLHRDINPSNVMLTHHGRIVVIDFGLARDFDAHPAVGVTRVVTPGYAPLEQYRGEGRFGPATDVYGLAATCYRLATGKVPVSALERDGGADLPAPHRVNPAISKEVGDAILDGLEIEPDHRPQDLDAFLARLGVRRLPEGPRSVLLDHVPPPVAPSAAPAGARPGAPAAWAPAAGVEPVSGETVVVARPSPSPPPPARPVAAAATVVAPRSPAPTDGLDANRRGVPVPPDGLDATRRPPSPGARVAPVAAPPPPAPTPLGPLAAGPDAARWPLAVGPHRPGRRKLLVPLVAVALATGSAAPVLVSALVVLVGLPFLATLGDSVGHRLRAEHGVAHGWAERRLAPGALAPARFLRNVAVSLLRSVPALAIGAVLLGAWYGLDGLSLPTAASNLVLRGVGLITVGLLVMTGRNGASGFRTGLGIEEVVARWVPAGRTTERLVVGWLVAAIVVAGALWLSPDPFPLP